MKHVIEQLRRAVFAAAVLGSLGFGAAEAFAAPPATAREATCNEYTCHRNCRLAGASGSWCDEYNGCLCFF